MTIPLLAADQDALVEALALRLAELVEARRAPRFVDATTLGRMLGISRSTVYEHAAELGGIQLGAGDRKLTRFDVEKALAAWTPCDASERSHEPDPPAPTDITRRRRRIAAQPDAGLLPIRGPA